MIELEVDIEKMNSLIETIQNIELLMQVILFLIAILLIYKIVRNILSWR